MLTACYLIVAFYLAARTVLAARASGAAAARRFLAECAVLACAAWLGESSCILLYGFYAYDASWGVFLDAVPLAVVLIWPVVIQSARDLAGSRAGLIVLADAAFIEPIAVRAGLWSWTEPGLFGVPPVGVLGWALFGGCCAVLLESRKSKPFGAVGGAALLLGPQFVLHAGLLAAWWGALRWMNAALPPVPAVAAAWLLSAALCLTLLRRGAGARFPRILLALRIPAALWFAVLLALDARDAGWLIAWSLAFAPPYLALFPSKRACRESI